MEILNEEVKLPHQNINPIQDGEEGQKYPHLYPHPTSFPPVTSANVRRSPQKFLTFSFNPFVTLM